MKPTPTPEYERTVEIDLSALEPTVSLPHLPSNTKVVSEVKGLPIQQVVIGSCTNGRISDLRQAAEILKGHHVHDGVRCIVIPATQQVSLDCIKEGLTEIFIEAAAPCPRRHAARASADTWAACARANAPSRRRTAISSGAWGTSRAKWFWHPPRLRRHPQSWAASQTRTTLQRRRSNMPSGKVYKYGDNVDTDVIIPARYLNAPLAR